MNILFLSTHLNTGGITSYLLTLTKELIAQGHQVHIGTSEGNMEEAFTLLGAKLLKLDIHSKSILDIRIYRALMPLKKYVSENNIDIIHSHTRITQVMGRLLKRLTSIPYVSTCHGFFKKKWSRLLIPCWGDNVIAISDQVKLHLIRDFGVILDQIVVIKSGVDIDEFNPTTDGQKRETRKHFGFCLKDVLRKIPIFDYIRSFLSRNLNRKSNGFFDCFENQ